MSGSNQKKIIRLLGVGFDAEDGHVRITKGGKFDVLMGSDESHEYITKLIAKIEDELEVQALSLDDLTPQQFAEFVKTLQI
jgi:hypothetical protein